MQATWSDINSEESGSITSEDARYDPNAFLAFIASMESVHDSEYDGDDKFTNNQKAAFLNNPVVKYKKLITNYLRDHDVIKAHKTKIDVLKEERTNLLEKKNISWVWTSFSP